MKNVKMFLSPREATQDDEIRRVAAIKLGIAVTEIGSIQIRKHSIDARQRFVRVNLSVDVYEVGEEMAEDDFSDIVFPDVSDCPSVVIVGAGPAGLFAALKLIELGVRPIILERGQDVHTRRRYLSELHCTGVVDPENNYSYGEGGAGAFSDGKLYTRSHKRGVPGAVEKIMRTFCKFGADPKILIDAHPHIGTDKLPLVIKNMREQIIASGGEVRFGCRMDKLLVDGNRTRGVQLASGEIIESSVVLLATGHSAREIYREFWQSGIRVEPKALAVGVRLEHPQHLIDEIRYHSPYGRGRYLPAAEYAYKTQVEERGVYSFCMCPGGFVIPASTAEHQTVVNGMSPANRGSKWANSGMVVAITPEDIPATGLEVEHPDSPLAMMEWCEQFEYQSYLAANQSLRAPAQRLTDFVYSQQASSSIGSTSYNLGLTPGNMHEWMPRYLSQRLVTAFKEFERTTRGFLTEEAHLIGVESRTSAPVRIPRNSITSPERPLQHLDVEGLYPVGEGAGYAGGIVSAAIDGQNSAMAIAAYVKGVAFKHE